MSVYTFNLFGPIVPKARARTTENGSYLPEGYSAWKANAILDIRQQYKGSPLDYAEITISLTGQHNRQGDIDNVAGSILDALVQSKVLVDDNMKRVRSLAIALSWEKKEEPKTVIVISTSREDP